MVLLVSQTWSPSLTPIFSKEKIFSVITLLSNLQKAAHDKIQVRLERFPQTEAISQCGSLRISAFRLSFISVSYEFSSFFLIKCFSFFKNSDQLLFEWVKSLLIKQQFFSVEDKMGKTFFFYFAGLLKLRSNWGRHLPCYSLQPIQQLAKCM